MPPRRNPSCTVLFCTLNTHIKPSGLLLSRQALEDAANDALDELRRPVVAGQLVWQQDGGYVQESRITDVGFEVGGHNKQFHLHFTWAIYASQHNVIGGSLTQRVQDWWKRTFAYQPAGSSPYFNYTLLGRRSGHATYQFRKLSIIAEEGDDERAIVIPRQL